MLDVVVSSKSEASLASSRPPVPRFTSRELLERKAANLRSSRESPSIVRISSSRSGNLKQIAWAADEDSEGADDTKPFYQGERVWMRNSTDESWKSGYVTKVEPLEAKPDDEDADIESQKFKFWRPPKSQA
eukprot:gnl/TRDRNA2_/TRDRNA2_138002_c1_seq1.p1 gnl/TRDRNA2_/TRDRNA2_138002_c1~~gnl/TRDRNA2_/TRDRNA2_138002_c1_seq1.p1  ORF type:complete len:138 (-),score=26.05 gnl/TRDRNA2_/TRDRNA2_138002_c1_seq1:97-489(-)